MKYLKFIILLTILCSFGYSFGEISPEWTYELPNSYCWDDKLSTTPNGDYIALCSNTEHTGKIYYFNKDGELLWANNLSNSNPLIHKSDDWSDGAYVDVVSIDDLKISPDGKYVVASIENISYYGIRTNWIFIFDNNGKILKKYKVKNGFARLSISSDGKYIFVVNGMHTYLIDRDSGILFDYETDGNINSMDMTPDGNYAFVGCDDGNVYGFNMSNKSLMWKYQTMGSVEDVSINPHAKLIGVGGMDGCIYILNYSGNLINKRNLNSSINSSVYYLKLTNCYNYNIIAYNSLKVHYLDKNLTTLWTYCPDSSTFIEIKDATPDGKYIALFTNYVDYLTYDDCEGYLEILNKNGTIAWQYPVFDDVSYAKITSDGRYVIAIVDDKLCFFDNQKCIKNYESQNHKHGIMVGHIDNRGLLIYVVVITLGIMIILLALAFYVIKLDKKVSNK